MTSLTDLHTELLAYLTASLTGVTVEAFSPEFLERQTTQLPGCWVEMVGIDPEPEFGNQRELSHVMLSWEARILVDPLVATGWTDIKQFAAVVMWALRRWVPQTDGAGPVTLKRAVPDEFKPGLDGFLVWLVEWEQEAYLDFADPAVLAAITRVTVTDTNNQTTVVE
jgi:hypothetical protein